MRLKSTFPFSTSVKSPNYPNSLNSLNSFNLVIYSSIIYHLFIYSSIIYSSIIYHLSSIIYLSIIYHLFIYTAGLFFSALRTSCVHLTARLVNNCRKYSAKRAAIKSHVWAHPLRPPNGASWDFIASCAISFFVRLRTGDRGCTNRKPVAEWVYAAQSLTLKNNRSWSESLLPHGFSITSFFD